MEIIKKAKSNWGYFIPGVFILLVILYAGYYGEDTYIQIHDNLDSNIVWSKMLKDNGLFWTHGLNVPFLGGTDRNYMCSEFKAYYWLYMLFPVFPAYIAGYVLKIIIAVSGSVFLGKILLKEQLTAYKNLVVLCGLLYAVLPTFPSSAFSFASLPFLLGMLYMLYYKKRRVLYIALFLYPLLSDFSTFGIFICGYLLFFIIADWIVKKRVNLAMIWGLASISLGYVITEYRLFYMMLFSSEPSIRTTMIPTYLSLKQILIQIRAVLLCGHYHSGSLHQYVVFPVCVCYCMILNLNYIRRKRFSAIWKDRYNWFMGVIVFNACIYGFNSYEPFQRLIGTVFPPLKGFSLARTLWFNPFLWYLSFAIVLYRLAKRKKERIAYALYIMALAVVFICPSTYNHISMNIQNRISEIRGSHVWDFTYRQFYSEELFETIKEEINYGGEYAVAFGMHPAVLEYNGIATLDGYFSNYAQAYKEQFGRLIAPELAEDSEHAEYFDKWGGRAYIFSGKNTYEPVYEMWVDEEDMMIDPQVFQEMNGKFVFSRVEITNAKELELECRGCFQNEESPYKIYVYRSVAGNDFGE